MKQISFLVFMCFFFTSIDAQESAIKSSMRRGKNVDGSYIALPKNLTVEKCTEWFSKNKEYVLIRYESKEKPQFGFLKNIISTMVFVPESEYTKYKVVNGLLSSLESGTIKNMSSILKQSPNFVIDDNITEKIAQNFADNYKKCIEIFKHKGVYSHSAGSNLIKTNFYRKPTADELTLSEDMKAFILLYPNIKTYDNLKKAALEYTNEVKNGDLLYYYTIFNDYGFKTKQEITELDNKTYYSADTKEKYTYYLNLFPDGLHSEKAKQMLNSGLYEQYVKDLNSIKNDAFKIISESKGYGLSDDIIVTKDFVNAFWSAFFGSSTEKLLYSSDSRINKMFTTVQNFKKDFRTSDPHNKIALADSILSLITIIDGLWAGDITLASSISVLGLWEIKDNWDGYIQDGSAFWGSECSETPKCAEVRKKMENALKTLDALLSNPKTEYRNSLIRVKEHISLNYSNLISIRDNNAFLCKMKHEEAMRRLQAERCAGCTIDFSKNESGKIVMKNGKKYEYKYSNGLWRITYNLILEKKYSTYEELLIDFLETCIREECK